MARSATTSPAMLAGLGFAVTGPTALADRGRRRQSRISPRRTPAMSGEGAVRQVTIDRLGHRGDGVAAGPLFVAYALPGEAVTVEVAGERGRLVSIEVPSPERIAPFCPYFGTCGGCAIQHLAEPAYRAWKRSLVVDALLQTGLDIDVAPLVDAHGDGRRRATLHGKGEVVGFAEARSHALVDIASCPILVPPLDRGAAGGPRRRQGPARPRQAARHRRHGDRRPGSTWTCAAPARFPNRCARSLRELATAHDLARIAIHGDVVVERRAPLVRFGARRRRAAAGRLPAGDRGRRHASLPPSCRPASARAGGSPICSAAAAPSACPRRDGHRRRLRFRSRRHRGAGARDARSAGRCAPSPRRRATSSIARFSPTS